MKVREVAMKNFSEAAIRPGEPMATLEDVLVPVYLLHRYQVEAAVQTIGGQDYRYAVRGDGQLVAKMVPGDEQRAALTAVLKTLDPQMLTLPEALLDKFPPRPSELSEDAGVVPGVCGSGVRSDGSGAGCGRCCVDWFVRWSEGYAAGGRACAGQLDSGAG